MTSKICFITAHLPSPISTQAGQKIAYNHLLWLSRYYDIILISCANKDEMSSYDPNLYDFCTEVHISLITHLSRFCSIIQKILLPFFVAFRYTKDIKKIIYKIHSSNENVIFWLEYVQMCQYIPKEKGDKKWIVVCHDILAQMFERKVKEARGLLKILYLVEKWRIMKFEQFYLKRCDSVVSLSLKDQKILSNYSIENNKVLYPMVGNLSLNKNKFFGGKEPKILFFGAMNRLENENAVCWFVDNAFKKLLNIYPNLEFMIIGANPTEKVKQLAQKNSNIIVTGFVEDPTIFFDKAWFSVAPLQLGAGVKIKVLECLAYGLPVIATTIGAEGIEAGEADGLIIANNNDIFRNKCLELLNSEKHCIQLGHAARQWYNEKYLYMQESPEKINRIIHECL